MDKKIKHGFIGQKMVVLPPDVISELKVGIMTSGFHITTIGYFPNAHYHNVNRPRGSKDYIFLYCIKGSGQVKFNTETYKLKPNHFIIVPRNTPHHYLSDDKSPWSLYWFHFDGSQADYLYSRFLNTTFEGVSKVPFSLEKVDEFKEAVDLVLSEFDEEAVEYSCLLIKNILCNFLFKERDLLHKPSNRVMQQARDFLKNNIDKEIGIENLSARFNLSVSRFSELYKLETGYSPIQHLILFRIQRSCQYLYFTDLSVKEIALKVGFSDPFYFSKMFKKLMKVTPTNYKKYQ